MKHNIIRSRLIMPANNEKFIEKSPFRNADAVVLDLEDSIPHDKKIESRLGLQESVNYVAKSASKVYVRVNNQQELLQGDLEASICKGLYGIYFPDVRSSEEIIEVENIIKELEIKNALVEGSIKISIILESVDGYLQMDEILESSKRIDTVTIGSEDFSKNTGIKINQYTKAAYSNIFIKMVLYAKKHNVIPLGLLGSITNYNDLDNMKEIIKMSESHGLKGASCIHPKVVEYLNAGFSPSSEKVKEAKELIETFENALNSGKAATTFKDRMIDIPHYEESKALIEKYNKIQEYENYKKSKIIQLEGEESNG